MRHFLPLVEYAAVLVFLDLLFRLSVSLSSLLFANICD